MPAAYRRAQSASVVSPPRSLSSPPAASVALRQTRERPAKSTAEAGGTGWLLGQAGQPTVWTTPFTEGVGLVGAPFARGSGFVGGEAQRRYNCGSSRPAMIGSPSTGKASRSAARTRPIPDLLCRGIPRPRTRSPTWSQWPALRRHPAPLIPEAESPCCARLGIMHSVVFGGFAAYLQADRRHKPSC